MTECSVSNCDRIAKTNGWCQAHYMRWWERGDLAEDRPIGVRKPSVPLSERFWLRVDRTPGGCWLWQGKPSKTGYCYVGVDGKSRLAHRVAFELAYGPIPEGRQVDHLCHNRDKSCRGGWGCPHRRCVNPQHLGLATQSENLRRSGRCGDRARERAAAVTHCPYGHRKERGGYCDTCRREGQRAKSLKNRGLPDPRRIDEATVQRVRELLAAGRSHSQIRVETGVSLATVSRIRNGGSWFSPA